MEKYLLLIGRVFIVEADKIESGWKFQCDTLSPDEGIAKSENVFDCEIDAWQALIERSSAPPSDPYIRNAKGHLKRLKSKVFESRYKK